MIENFSHDRAIVVFVAATAAAAAIAAVTSLVIMGMKISFILRHSDGGGRHEICPKFYTVGFSGHNFYTVNFTYFQQFIVI